MALINVKKADGETEPFSKGKLRHSLRKAGAKEDIVEEVVSDILDEFKGQTTSTTEIYKKAFRILKKKEIPATAARYSLKRAVLGLGPSGFPFEYFIAEIFKAKGYKARTGVIMAGGCAKHEVDVLAENNEEVVAVEAKFHNKLGFKSDMKVLLYVSARFRDLEKNAFDGRQKKGLGGRGLVVTNTNFTTNAISFAKCAGIEAVSWNYPEEGNLHDLIEETALHPITCLTTISDAHKKKLIDKGTVLCKMVRGNRTRLRQAGISEKKIDAVIEEAGIVCNPRYFNKQ